MSHNQPPSQNSDLNNLNSGREIEQNLNPSSNSSSSHAFISCFNELTTRNREIGLQGPSDFFNLGMWKEKTEPPRLKPWLRKLRMI
jgi:hypothetical protein